MESSAYTQSQRQGLENLVQEYLPLVKKIGLHLVARLPREVELDDLMQVGMMALVQANENYDPAQGASFSTYAGIRIKGAMLDEVRRNDWVPRPVQQNIKRVADAMKQLEARLGRSVTDTEIAAELGLPLEDYHKLSREIVYSRMTSLEDVTEAGESEELDPVAQLDDVQTRQLLARAIQTLPEKEKLMMSLYYVEELNLKEIGAVMGVSESRVSQIHGQALARMRAKVSEWDG